MRETKILFCFSCVKVKKIQKHFKKWPFPLTFFHSASHLLSKKKKFMMKQKKFYFFSQLFILSKKRFCRRKKYCSQWLFSEENKSTPNIFHPLKKDFLWPKPYFWFKKKTLYLLNDFYLFIYLWKDFFFFTLENSFFTFGKK